MPKLPSISAKKLMKILQNLGFELDHATGSHFIYFNSKTKKRAVVPYHTKDLPIGTVMSIIRSINLSRKEFEDLLK